MRNPKISKTTRRSTCGGAEIVIGSIDDLLKQILVHLPLKPLVRFKLVSKHWNSIISDPRFQIMRSQRVQHNNNRAIGLFILYCRWKNPPKETLRFVSLSSSNPPPPAPPQIHNNIPDTLEIFHSCNGLFVLKSTALEKNDYYVYNPTTKQKPRPLKGKKGGWAPDCVLGMYLAFDPAKSPHDYKVVCVWKLSRTNRHAGEVQFDVYSSETGSWEIRSRSFTGNIAVDSSFDKGVYWNGAIHWFNTTGDSIYLNLDDEDEMPRVMPDIPTHYENKHGYYSHIYFGESCGHLHCAFLVGDHQLARRRVYVYEMRRDYSEWFLKYRVDEDYSQCLGKSYKVQYLQSVVRGNEDEDTFLVLGNAEGEVIRYNIVHDTFQTIQVKDLDPDTNSMIPLRTFQYIESLCSV